MINWIVDNFSTIIVALILLFIVILIIKNLINSRHTCGCDGCGNCPMASKCHPKIKE